MAYLISTTPSMGFSDYSRYGNPMYDDWTNTSHSHYQSSYSPSYNAWSMNPSQQKSFHSLSNYPTSSALPTSDASNLDFVDKYRHASVIEITDPSEASSITDVQPYDINDLYVPKTYAVSIAPSSSSVRSRYSEVSDLELSPYDDSESVSEYSEDPTDVQEVYSSKPTVVDVSEDQYPSSSAVLVDASEDDRYSPRQTCGSLMRKPVAKSFFSLSDPSRRSETPHSTPSRRSGLFGSSQNHTSVASASTSDMISSVTNKWNQVWGSIKSCAKSLSSYSHSNFEGMDSLAWERGYDEERVEPSDLLYDSTNNLPPPDHLPNGLRPEVKRKPLPPQHDRLYDTRDPPPSDHFTKASSFASSWFK